MYKYRGTIFSNSNVSFFLINIFKTLPEAMFHPKFPDRWRAKIEAIRNIEIVRRDMYGCDLLFN